MTPVEQLQLSDLQGFLPVIVSECDHRIEKAVGVTLKMDVKLSDVCARDCVSRTLDLGLCVRRIREYWEALECAVYVWDFSRRMVEIVDGLGGEGRIEVAVKLPGSSSLSKEVVYKARRDGGWSELLVVGDICGRVLIGCKDAERCQRQDIRVEVEGMYPKVAPERLPRINTQSLISSIIGEMERGEYNTMECLASRIVDFVEERYCFVRVCVFLQKMHGALGGLSSGVRIGRATRHALAERGHMEAKGGEDLRTAYICVGSNMGDKVGNIHSGLKLLKECGVEIVDTSFLYLSGYQGDGEVSDREFVNAGVKIRTLHSASSLLRVVKGIEERVGRMKARGTDDRKIDLDIVFYEDLVVDSRDLVIPHPRLHLREWVLRPLADIDPFFMDPLWKMSVRCLLEGCLRKIDLRASVGLDVERMPFVGVERVMWLGSKLYRWGSLGSTLVMGILNVTPDSFSDGGCYLSLCDARKRFIEMVEQGADIVDIGGVSTRPGAASVDVEEEYSRVIPVLEDVRKIDKDAIISIDTTSARIARECLRRGANLINTTLHADGMAEMYEVVADLSVPIVLMHSRGTPRTMGSLVSSARGQSLLEEVSKETNDILMEARRSGVYRWNIILDPGIGFAKTPMQSVEVMSGYHRHHPFSSYPCLVGHSRKSFIEKVGLSVPGDCVHPATLWGTLGGTSMLCRSKTFIVRVHDVPENASIVKLYGLLCSSGLDP
ncbi:dihydropteroate synthase [Encephalitozoon hellem]|uniref:Dihydropteroate synthase n=1 Tax=Encephalitozoon hellem TaxID=27973 RepID=A0ABY8CHL9_ENCHE|nr:dihydropteroate synthase [Encephalitozoon hellem]WEL38551.1 dihydropteroate synthase [Encephalitozoon hellem]WEL38752.1 dihydropteroate synthase [Encephalitozoon hellem]